MKSPLMAGLGRSIRDTGPVGAPVTSVEVSDSDKSVLVIYKTFECHCSQQHTITMHIYLSVYSNMLAEVETIHIELPFRELYTYLL